MPHRLFFPTVFSRRALTSFWTLSVDTVPSTWTNCPMLFVDFTPMSLLPENVIRGEGLRLHIMLKCQTTVPFSTFHVPLRLPWMDAKGPLVRPFWNGRGDHQTWLAHSSPCPSNRVLLHRKSKEAQKQAKKSVAGDADCAYPPVPRVFCWPELCHTGHHTSQSPNRYPSVDQGVIEVDILPTESLQARMK